MFIVIVFSNGIGLRMEFTSKAAYIRYCLAQ